MVVRTVRAAPWGGRVAGVLVDRAGVFRDPVRRVRGAEFPGGVVVRVPGGAAVRVGEGRRAGVGAGLAERDDPARGDVRDRGVSAADLSADRARGVARADGGGVAGIVLGDDVLVGGPGASGV